MSYEKRVIELASERHYIVPNWFYGVIKEADAAIAKRDEVIGRLREMVEAHSDLPSNLATQLEKL